MPAVFVAPLETRVRCRPFLDAMGAQEWIEHKSTQRPALHAGESKFAAWRKERDEAARRRNAAEKKLRPAEASAFAAWRKLDAHGREAVRAIITDWPPARLRSPNRSWR